MKKTIIIFIINIILILNYSCNSTKYLEKNEYLLKSYKINCVDKNIKPADFESYVKQKPNKSFIGVPLYLNIYNLVDPQKEEEREIIRKQKEEEINVIREASGKKPKEKPYITRWIRKIGEPPVVYNQVFTEKSKKQFKLYLKRKGYYNPEIYSEKKIENKKISINYFIKPNAVYKVKKINIDIEDKSIDSIISKNRNKSFLKPEIDFDIDILEKERNRINKIMLNNGYYEFVKEYITYSVDTSLGNHQVKLTLKINNIKRKNNKESFDISLHKRYKINNINIYPNFNPQLSISKQNKYLSEFTSIKQNRITYTYHKKNPYKISLLKRGVSLYSDSLYKEENVESTFDYYSSLMNFKLINVDFKKNSSLQKENKNYLDCYIRLFPITKQSYSLELEGSSSAGKYGMAAKLNYQHRNLFKGAEILNLDYVTSFDNRIDLPSSEDSYFNVVENGITVSLKIPKFMFPLKAEKFNKKNTPKTNFLFSYNYQRSPDISKYIISSSFGYQWKTSKHMTHFFYPMELYSIKYSSLDSSYVAYILDKYLLEESFDRVIASGKYGFLYNNQKVNKKIDFIYLKFNIELSGNLLNIFNKTFNEPQVMIGDIFKPLIEGMLSNYDDSERQELMEQRMNAFNKADNYNKYYRVFKLPYFQYAKTEIDFRYYHYWLKNNLVFRIYTGAIIPYGSELGTPIEKEFFIGGSNSIRAWKTRSIGPGTFNVDTVTEYAYAQSHGDIKLLANIEYRRNLFWVVEGALFVDIGNIWSIDKNDSRKGAYFQKDSFYKDLIIGTGLGVRLDFSFFVLRVDMGIKIKDPTLSVGSKWLGKKALKWDEISFNFGIGYPF